MALPFAQLGFPEMFEQALVGPLFRPWVDSMLDAVRLAPGDRVLDVACGTGIVARVARERLGGQAMVAGVDVSAPMLEVARRVAPDIDWRQGDAAALPLRAGEQFDVVCCQQGLQFFADKAAAVREMRRALAPGGRVAVSTWRPDDEIPFGLALRRQAEKHVGPIADRRHSFGDPAAIESLLGDAGFDDISSSIVSLPMHFDDGLAFVRMNAMALVGMSAGGRDLGDADRERLVDEISRDSAGIAAASSTGADLTFELRTNLLTARARA